MKSSVKIGMKTYEIEVYQRAMGVWIASGDYEGESLEVEGRTQALAIRLWRETATYKSG